MDVQILCQRHHEIHIQLLASYVLALYYMYIHLMFDVVWFKQEIHCMTRSQVSLKHRLSLGIAWAQKLFSNIEQLK